MIFRQSRPPPPPDYVLKYEATATTSSARIARRSFPGLEKATTFLKGRRSGSARPFLNVLLATNACPGKENSHAHPDCWDSNAPTSHELTEKSSAM